MHTRRGGNRVAHGLAKLASGRQNTIWIEECPHDIEPQVLTDGIHLVFI